MKKGSGFVLGLCVGVSLLSTVARTGADIVRMSQDKVVKIGVVAYPKGHWIGSGAIVSKDGLILTCGHLFSHNTVKVFVKTAGGQTYLARLVRLDHVLDLAIIKIDPPGPLPYFKLGSDPYIGQPVVAFGSPLDIQGTVTFGYIENVHYGEYTIQGCPTNPGNSGGPLVDYRGRLVGVNVAILLLNPFQLAQNLGLAVDLPTIREFVRR